MNASSIKNDERIIFALRTLYGGYGYAKYKMSKFEEYDLYVRNKDFLISDSVITFTDTNGKLMALKPDVTLSIVKNSRDNQSGVQKLYYNENVYRVSRGTHTFREIVQVGLECIGAIDDYCIFEVLLLAAESLKCISDRFVLNISHLGLLSEVLNRMGAAEADRPAILRCIGEKNSHELSRLCDALKLDPAPLNHLISCYGAPGEVLPALRAYLGDSPSLSQLEKLMQGFGDDASEHLRIDFSVVNDVNYYNGVVFKGFIEGVPEGVLSGGQYDRLMNKMGRKSGAIGFAVYMDALERLNENERKYDVDLVLLYDECDLSGLHSAIRCLRSQGLSVTAQRSIPEQLRCRTLARYENGEVKTLEEYA